MIAGGAAGFVGVGGAGDGRAAEWGASRRVGSGSGSGGAAGNRRNCILKPAAWGAWRPADSSQCSIATCAANTNINVENRDRASLWRMR
jgi:hypothetical protein